MKKNRKREPQIRVINVDGKDYVMETTRKGGRVFKHFYNVEYS